MFTSWYSPLETMGRPLWAFSMINRMSSTVSLMCGIGLPNVTLCQLSVIRFRLVLKPRMNRPPVRRSKSRAVSAVVIGLRTKP